MRIIERSSSPIINSMLNSDYQKSQRRLRGQVRKYYRKKYPEANNRQLSIYVNQALKSETILRQIKGLRSKRTIFKNDTIKWLHKQNWQYFATFTFNEALRTPLSILHYEYDVEYEQKEKTILLDSVHEYMNIFEKVLSEYDWRKWEIYYTIEKHKSGKYHVHALLKNDYRKPKDKQKIRSLWNSIRGGYMRMDEIPEPKDLYNKVVGYTTKYLVKEDDYYKNWGYLIAKGGIGEDSAENNIPDLINNARLSRYEKLCYPKNFKILHRSINDFDKLELVSEYLDKRIKTMQTILN